MTGFVPEFPKNFQTPFFRMKVTTDPRMHESLFQYSYVSMFPMDTH